MVEGQKSPFSLDIYNILSANSIKDTSKTCLSVFYIYMSRLNRDRQTDRQKTLSKDSFLQRTYWVAAGMVVGVVMVMSMVVAIVHNGLLLMHVAEGVAEGVAVLRSVVVVAEGQAVVTA